jgi:hypothetical protein
MEKQRVDCIYAYILFVQDSPSFNLLLSSVNLLLGGILIISIVPREFEIGGTYNLSLSGLELLLGSLELLLLPLSDVLTLFSLFSLAVLLAHTTQLKRTSWRCVVGVSDVICRDDMEM